MKTVKACSLLWMKFNKESACSVLINCFALGEEKDCLFFVLGAMNRRCVRTPACDILLDWFVFSANINSALTLHTHYSHYKSNQHTRINERKDKLRRLKENSGK